SAFTPRSSRSSSRPSSRPTAAPAAGTAARGSAWRSAARSPGSSGARSRSSAPPARGARSSSTSRTCTRPPAPPAGATPRSTRSARPPHTWRSRWRRPRPARHVAGNVISGPEQAEQGVGGGAVGIAGKALTGEALEAPLARLEDCVNRPVKNLLLIVGDPLQRARLVELIGNGDVHTTAV